MVNDATGEFVRADPPRRRSGCEVSIIVTDAKRNDAHDCFDQVNIRYKVPEVLAASGIHPVG